MNIKSELKGVAILGVSMLCLCGGASAQNENAPKFRHISNSVSNIPQLSKKDVSKREEIKKRYQEAAHAALEYKHWLDSLTVRSVPEILDETVVPEDIPSFNRLLAPWVFTDYRALDRRKKIEIPDYMDSSRQIWEIADKRWKNEKELREREETDSVALRRKALDELWGIETTMPEEVTVVEAEDYLDNKDYPILSSNYRPRWIDNIYEAWNMQEDMMYEMMVDTPSKIRYAYWLLPVPPKLPDEDYSFHGFLKRHSVSGIDINNAVIREAPVEKKHWLHVFNSALQFSQAFLSPNWYQGGNNHVALLANVLWDVQLNPVWHPNMLFQSTFSYKLGLNSVEDDQYRKYSISQDIFQYNVKFGYKAKRNWYYSVTGQIKTQMLANYKKGTEDRIASFLTPGDLNFGIGMTYSKANKKKTVQFNASIAPLSYNWKTAIDKKIDHALFKMPQTARFETQIGSNAEITFNWNPNKIVSYKTRLFLFTDYKYGMGDWENNFNFQFSKVFSTQLYFNVRYDSSLDLSALNPEVPNDMKKKHWGHWMLKEIVSLGLSYTFSTKK